MRKLFEQYGGVVWATIAVVALVGVVFMFFMGNGNGWIEGSFKDTIDAFGNKTDVAIEGQPRLDTPDISISGSTLTITPVENATSYEVYNGDELLTTTTATTVELGTYLTEFGAYTVRVRALADGYKPSGYGEEDYVLELEPGLYKTGTNYTVLIKSWDTLISEGTITVVDNVITGAGYLPGDLLIANSVTGIKEATSAPNGAFGGCTSLTGVIIPDGVTTVSPYAFYGCTSLASIVIPDGVTSIGKQAFYGCTALTSIDMPDDVTSIGDYAFEGCTSLTSINIPDNVNNIGTSAFRNCESLASIDIPDKVSYVLACTFYNCTSLTSVVIPDNVTAITANAFYGCTGLETISIGKNAREVDSSAFAGCNSVTSITVDSENTTYSSSGNCLIKKATKQLVWGCKNSVIPSDGSVTSIGQAFRDNTALTSITIPKNITKIYSYSFAGCTNLSGITFDGTVDEWNAITKESYWNNQVPATEVVCTDGTVSLS